MVIFAAVGGRTSLVGAVYGTLLVNFGKTYFSEKFPQLWLFLMGALFIGVVMVFPNGLAGLYESHGRAWLAAARERATRLSPAAIARGTAAACRQRRCWAATGTTVSERRLETRPAGACVQAAQRDTQSRHRCATTCCRRRPDRLVRRLQGRRRSVAVRRAQRAARGDRPQRRGQDHAARSDLGQHARHLGQRQVQGARAHWACASTRSCAPASAASSRRRRSTNR